MKKIQYTPDAADKLRAIKKYLTIVHGSTKAGIIIGKITKAIRGLVENENIGPSVESMFDVPYDYRYIVTQKNYVFYRVEEDVIRVINIYNEKEDFMSLMFGVDTTIHGTLNLEGFPYPMEIIEDKDEGGYVISFPDLPGCITCGETMESAIKNARDALKVWIEAKE